MKVRQNVDYTTRDYEGFRNDMLTLLKQKIPEYSDFSQSDMGVVLIELLAHGLDIISFYNDRIANEIFPDTALDRESIVKHCRRLGYELQNAVPSQFKQVFKITPQTYDYFIPRGMKLITNGEETVEFELIEDLTIPANCTGVEQDHEGNYLYTALVEHGSTITSDIVGTSNGEPYQEFTLSYPNVILDSLVVFVRNEHTIEQWERVANFIDSDRTSKQYMVEVLDNGFCKITFGNGTSGMIPSPYDNGISANYRVGGGIDGNIPLHALTELPSKPATIVETFNVEQTQLGTDAETLEQARIHAPLSLRTLWRAVTLYDYENLLKQEFPEEILSVKAVAENDRFTVTIYVLTNSPQGDLPDDNKEKYLEFLDERKEIGYNLVIKPPKYSDVSLNVTVKTNKGNFNEHIQNVVNAHLHANYDGIVFGFGEELIVSQIMKEILMLQGVIDVNIVANGNLTPSSDTIVRITEFNVSVSGGA